MSNKKRQEAKARIAAALKSASSLIVIEVLAPPEHEFEKEKRYKAREHVQKMCIAALADLLLL